VPTSVAPLTSAWRKHWPGGFAANPAGPLLPGGNGQTGVPLLPASLNGAYVSVLAAWGADPTTDPTGWQFTDLTSYVQFRPGIQISRGREDEQSQAGPSTCVFEVLNTSGNFTPRRVTGAWWPYVRLGTPVKVVVYHPAFGDSERISGFISAIEPYWDVSGNVAKARITVKGLLETLGQGDDQSRSATYRSTSTNPVPVAYWPLEDGSKATQAAAAVGGVPLSATGTINFASDSGLAGSDPLPTPAAGSVLFAYTPSFGASYSYASSGWSVAWLMKIPSLPGTDTPLMHWWSFDATVKQWDVTLTTTGLIKTRGFGSAGTELFGDAGIALDGSPFLSTVLGRWLAFSTIFDPTSAAVFSRWDLIEPSTATLFSRTGNSVFPSAAVREPFAIEHRGFGASIGHMALLSRAAVIDAYAAYGWPGDTVSARLARLATEHSIRIQVSSTSARLMGPQSTDSINGVLRECEAVDGGLLEDGADFGVRLNTLDPRYNQAATLTPALNDVGPPLLPVENNQRTRNDATASRPNGSSARFVQPAGRPYAPTGQGGVRTFTSKPTVNTLNDLTLPGRASLAVALGTVDDDRYPHLELKLHARPAQVPQWLAVVPGRRITVASTFATGGNAPDVIVEGWAEVITQVTWDVEANCSPYKPYDVGTVGSDYRVDAAGSTLASDLATGMTAVSDTFTRSVSNSFGTADTGQVWSVSDGPAGDQSVSGSAGVHSMASVNVLRGSRLALSVAQSDVDITLTHAGVSAAPLGAAYEQELTARFVDNSNLVSFRIFRAPAGTVTCAVRQLLAGVETVSSFPTVSGVTSTDAISMRFQTAGSTIRGKAWLQGSAEPAAWTIELSAITMTSPGDVEIRSLLEAGNTNTLPVLFDYAGLTVAKTLSVTKTGPLWTTTGPFPFYLSVGGGMKVQCTSITGSVSPQTFTVAPSDVVRAMPVGSAVTVWSPLTVALGVA
jgi:hypothetical protein